MSPRDQDAVAGRVLRDLRNARFDLEAARTNAKDTAALLRAVAAALEGTGVDMPASEGRFEIQTGIDTSVAGPWPTWATMRDLIEAVGRAKAAVIEAEDRKRDLGI